MSDEEGVNIGIVRCVMYGAAKVSNLNSCDKLIQKNALGKQVEASLSEDALMATICYERSQPNCLETTSIEG